MNEIKRYNSIAISLHWLIAFFLIGLLAVGKYMTHLEETDALRFTLTQWHKSFGIMVMFLAVIRVLWRLTHKPPELPESTSRFERFGSSVTHFLMYVLMVIIPVSGWAFVSASPLNLETELFGVMPWPHISFLASSPDKGALADQAGLLHMWFGNALILLVLMHAGAALFHQFFHRDQLISRMLVSASHREAGDVNHGLVAGILLAIAGGLFLVDASDREAVAPAVIAGSTSDTTAIESIASTVEFVAQQVGEPLNGQFPDAEVMLVMSNSERSLTAKVQTSTVSTGDSQMDGTLVTSDWFGSEEYPEANFKSTGFDKVDEVSYNVTGDLTIRGQTQSIAFVLSLDADVGRGEFTIDRRDFGVGDAGQDEFVDPQVVIKFAAQVITEL